MKLHKLGIVVCWTAFCANSFAHDWTSEEPVYSSDERCSESDGVPAGLWGNIEEVDTTETSIFGGQGLKIQGVGLVSKSDRGTYRYFESLASCQAYLKNPDDDFKPSKVWYLANRQQNQCTHVEESPADYIRKLQANGITPETTDLKGGGVQVTATQQVIDLYTHRPRPYVTSAEYYPSESACTSVLPLSQKISSKYE